MSGAFIVMVLQIMTGLVIWSTAVGFAQPNARPGTLKLSVQTISVRSSENVL